MRSRGRGPPAPRREESACLSVARKTRLIGAWREHPRGATVSEASLEYQNSQACITPKAREGGEYPVIEPEDWLHQPALPAPREDQVERHERDGDELELAVLEGREYFPTELPVRDSQRMLVRGSRGRRNRAAKLDQRIVAQRLMETARPPGRRIRLISWSAVRSSRWCRTEPPTMRSKESSSNGVLCASATRKSMRSP